MDDLRFRCEYDPRHGVWVKVRDDGRRGACVGDEAALWQALVALRERAEQAEAVAAAVAAEQQETGRRRGK